MPHEMTLPAGMGRIDATNDADLKTVQDTNGSRLICEFSATVTKDQHYILYLPDNWLSGNLTARLRWRANDVAGAAYWNLYYQPARTSGDLITAANSNVQVTTTTDATANDLNETVFSGITAAAAGRLYPFLIRREGAQAADTLAVVSQVFTTKFEYTADKTILKVYGWFPASAFTIPATSTASLSTLAFGSGGLGNDVKPYTIALPDGVTSFADVQVSLPSNLVANVTCRAILATVAGDTGNFRLREDAISPAVGESVDQALTAGTAFTQTGGAGQSVYFDSHRALPMSAAASELLILRVNRIGADAADSSTATVHLVGVVIAFDVFTKHPGLISLIPQASSVPTAEAATITQVNDTNSSRRIAEFLDGVTQKMDYVSQFASGYGGGGTVRVRWRATAAAGDGIFHVYVASPAGGSASDVAFVESATGQISDPTAGAGLLNEFTADISTAIAASDQLLLRVEREGGDVLDTLGTTVQVLDVQVEYNIA